MSSANAQAYQDIEDSYASMRNASRHIPFGGYEVGSLEATEVDFDPEDYLLRMSTKSFPKWQFKTNGFRILSSKPIQVVITRQDGTYYAENEALEIYASGDSDNEALENFVYHVIYFYKHYKTLDWHKVTGRAKELKQIYLDLFEEPA